MSSKYSGKRAGNYKNNKTFHPTGKKTGERTGERTVNSCLNKQTISQISTTIPPRELWVNTLPVSDSQTTDKIYAAIPAGIKVNVLFTPDNVILTTKEQGVFAGISTPATSVIDNIITSHPFPIKNALCSGVIFHSTIHGHKQPQTNNPKNKPKVNHQFICLFDILQMDICTATAAATKITPVHTNTYTWAQKFALLRDICLSVPIRTNDSAAFHFGLPFMSHNSAEFSVKALALTTYNLYAVHIYSANTTGQYSKLAFKNFKSAPVIARVWADNSKPDTYIAEGVLLSIPDYYTSVWMNKLFRGKMPEYEHVDNIEMSDDETDDAPATEPAEAKFGFKILCEYHPLHKKLYPVRLMEPEGCTPATTTERMCQKVE